MGKLALFEKIIKTYSKGELYNNIYKSSKKFLTMPSVFSGKEVVQVPLSSFTRTSNGDIVLYRGLKNCPVESTDVVKSVAATLGKTKSEILSTYKGSKLDIARDFSSLTQGNDPILHTTTKRKIAKSFADNGIIIEYHIPQKYIEKEGIVAHLAENEIDFFHSIDKKFIAKITKTKSKPLFKSDLPQTIQINF